MLKLMHSKYLIKKSKLGLFKILSLFVEEWRVLLNPLQEGVDGTWALAAAATAAAVMRWCEYTVQCTVYINAVIQENKDRTSIIIMLFLCSRIHGKNYSVAQLCWSRLVIVIGSGSWGKNVIGSGSRKNFIKLQLFKNSVSSSVHSRFDQRNNMAFNICSPSLSCWSAKKIVVIPYIQ